MIDIDFFKEYNDQYGHLTGDCGIKQIADVLTANARRASDKVARYGGDEFVVLLPHTDRENAMSIAERMRKGVEDMALPHARSGTSDCVTISLGVGTVIPSDESTPGEFFSSTDKALYAAKGKRNSAVFAETNDLPRLQ